MTTTRAMRRRSVRDLRPAIDLELERRGALLDLELFLESRELLVEIGPAERSLVATELVFSIARERHERVLLFAPPRRLRVHAVRRAQSLVRRGRSRSFQNIRSLFVVTGARLVVGLLQRAVERLVCFDGASELDFDRARSRRCTRSGSGSSHIPAHELPQLSTLEQVGVHDAERLEALALAHELRPKPEAMSASGDPELQRKRGLAVRRFSDGADEKTAVRDLQQLRQMREAFDVLVEPKD